MTQRHFVNRRSPMLRGCLALFAALAFFGCQPTPSESNRDADPQPQATDSDEDASTQVAPWPERVAEILSASFGGD